MELTILPKFRRTPRESSSITYLKSMPAILDLHLSCKDRNHWTSEAGENKEATFYLNIDEKCIGIWQEQKCEAILILTSWWAKPVAEGTYHPHKD